MTRSRSHLALDSLDKRVYWQVPQRKRPSSNAILFCRHVSSADTVLAPWVAGYLMGYSMRMVMKRELLLDPVMESLGTRCRCFFIDRKSPEMELEIQGLVRTVPSEEESNVCCTIYPEGTRASEEKRALALESLRRRNSPLLPYAQKLKQLLPPRLHGPMAMLRNNPNSDLLFVGHVGYDDALTLADAITGATNHQPILVKVFRVEHRELPEEEAALEKFFLDQWAKLDAWVDQTKRDIAQNPAAFWKRVEKEQNKIRQ